MSVRRPTAVLAAAALLAALLVVVASRPARSAGGTLDTTFNATGVATLDLGPGGTDAVTDLLIDGDGKIVVVGPSSTAGFGIARYLATGALDTAFGVNGIVTGVFMSDVRGVVRQSDGKLVVAGRSAATNGALVVARYLSTGAPDTTFSGDGRVETAALVGASSGGVDVALQTDGKVLALAVDNGLLAVYRYDASGLLDTTWGGDGRVDTSAAPSLADRIVATTAGVVVTGGDDVLRFETVDGDPDPTFDTDGIATAANHVARALAVQADGKVLTGGDLGAAGTQALVARRNADGSLDTGWDADGVALFAVTGLSDPSVHAMAVQTDGKVVVTGRQDDGAATSTIFVARLTSVGALDPTFATNGVATFGTLASRTTSTADAVAVDSTGRIVIGGAVSGTTSDFLVARVLVTDTPATTTTSSTTTTTAPGHTVVGGTARSDVAGTVPTPANEITASVTTPTAGVITFTKGDGTAITGYRTLAGVSITAPSGTATSPLRLDFGLNVAGLPAALPLGAVSVLRNGAVVEPCTSPTTATPDPCVLSRTRDDDVMSFTVLSSAASTWQLARPVVQRIAGASRVESAISASRSTFADDGAGAVVLARSDSFADALAATPLAVRKEAPLLLSDPAALDDATLVEVIRVLPPGGTVFALGGVGALSELVEDRLLDWGFAVERIAGLDRFETAVAIAEELGSPDVVVETTGFGFADALAAGAVAAEVGGAVLLTSGAQQSAPTLTYLARHRPTRYAIGGPAALADTSAERIVGENRYETSVLAALAFFQEIDAIGFASGTSFPDALSGGTHAGHAGAPLVLVPPTGALPVSVDILLRAEAATPPAAFLYGGTGAVAEDVATSLRALLGG